MNTTCVVCGNDLPPGRREYCSDECRNTIYQFHKAVKPGAKKCGVCGRESTRGSYCSRECELIQQRRTFGGLTVRELPKRDGAA